MTSAIRMVLILFLAPAIILSIHAILARLSNASRQGTALKASLFGFAPIALLSWRFVFPLDSAGSSAGAVVCYIVIVYLCMAYCYFHLFNMSETARRIRILYEIHRSGSLTAQSMSDLYRSSNIVTLRLKRLVELKQLRLENGFYFIAGRTLYAASLIIVAWRSLLRLDKEPNQL